MRLDKIVYLSTSKTPKRKVFARVLSIRQSEFYQAANQSLKPEIMVETRDFDYKDDNLLEYNEVNYRIIRTFTKSDGFIELICQKKVGV